MTGYYTEKQKSLPVIWDGEILVVGGGTAGAPAAIAAARSGKKTLLVEQLAFLGGTASAALVTPLMHTGIPGNPSPGSLNTEINRRMREIGSGATDSGGGDGWFDPLILPLVLEDMAIEAGVKILYSTLFSDVISENGAVKGIIIENKGGRQAILANRIIDATGDADVAFRAGCPFESGRPDNHINQPTSLRFEVSGIETGRFEDFLKSLGQKTERTFPFFHTAMVWNRNWRLEPVFRQAVLAGDLLESDGNYFQAFGIPGKPSSLAFNCPELEPQVDVTSPPYQSRSLASGRKSILRLFRFMKKYFPGFENSFLSQIAVMIGIRESRRIIGEYVLTGKDILTFRKFDDAISRSNYPVDIHGAQLDSGDIQIPNFPESERYYEIPCRCLFPLKVENLIVAGRCISADFVAQSSTRIQPTCRGLGEAAGIAAAMSLDEGIPPRKVDGKTVRSRMKIAGAFL
ncbi:FAD-dependent oxidoreductase [Candidatus Sumerlaeota bacterium]|nr:FAD-dependent oxidoreductase [Candidatus Sumerlaeota bacterium]